MLFRLTLLLALLLDVTSLRAAPVRILSWNVENYLSMDRRSGGTYRPDYPKPESEKAAIRALILSLQPHMLVLQEMGPEPYLIELQRDLHRSGLAFPHRFLGSGADADRHLALLSRIPVSSARMLTSSPSSRDAGLLSDHPRRGVLAALIATPRGHLALFSVHLKSRITTDPEDPQARRQRAAEARAVRDAIEASEELSLADAALLVGDFNAAINAPEMSAVRTRGERTLWNRLDARDGNGDTWTYHNRSSGDYSTIDHCLVRASGREVPLAQAAWIPDLPRLAGSPGASDHRPLVIDLAPIPD